MLLSRFSGLVAVLIVSASFKLSFGYTLSTRPLSLNRLNGNVPRAHSRLSMAAEVESSKILNEDIFDRPLSAREARIVAPVAAALTALLSTSPDSVAHAATEEFNNALNTYFGGSMINSKLASRVSKKLREREYRPSNTLVGSSLCSDEVNDSPESLLAVFRRQLLDTESGRVFNLGGLGGLPFAGLTGFGAFVSHCPEDGKVFVVYGPHVGISQAGQVGKVERIGQGGKASTSCGAAVGAYKAIKAGAQTASNPLDFQEEYIIDNLKPLLGNLAELEAKGEDATIAFTTNQMYKLTEDLMKKEVDASTSKSGFWNRVDEVLLLGGIVINRSQFDINTGQDYFQPLSMTAITADGETDLYDEVFGDLATPRNVLKAQKSKPKEVVAPPATPVPPTPETKPEPAAAPAATDGEDQKNLLYAAVGLAGVNTLLSGAAISRSSSAQAQASALEEAALAATSILSDGKKKK